MEVIHETITRPPRKFVPEELEVDGWAAIQPYFEDLLQRKLTDEAALRQWLADRSELGSIVGEEFRWRYVRQTCDTENTEYQEAFEQFVSDVQPELMQMGNALDKKLSACALIDKLDSHRFKVFLRQLKNNLELFREENVPLYTELELQAKEYDAIISRMTIDWHGEELTLPQASKKLQEPDRNIREAAFTRVNERRMRDRDEIHTILDALLKKRHLVAQQAGFDNYRDYKMREMGRFDYTVEDCFAFHDAIAAEVVPLVEKLYRKRKSRLSLDQLRPFDLDVDVSGQPPLNPFKDSEQLIGKSAHCLSEVDPYFAECLRIMQAMGHLDLESRKGKAPGGYNMSMPEVGVPFIFMNAAGTANDVRTMVHEMGHAVHSFLTRSLDYDFDKEFTSEVAELASMSMELFTLESQRVFYKTDEEHQRALHEQLEHILIILPWTAVIDKFQHWLYTHPGHTWEEREAEWVAIHKQFSPDIVDWSGYEPYRKIMWQKQLHIFDVPFYYIEYGIAQLGALGMWLNFQRDPRRAIHNYKSALSLGYTRTIPEIYAEAGVPFNFSKDYVKNLAHMVAEKLHLD
jgi:oligoendopeptidase F